MGSMSMADLKKRPQWVCFNDQKIPVNPRTGRWASVTEQSDWADAATAWAGRNRLHLPGISFVFTLETGVVGIDLDKCFDEEGELSDTARQVVDMVNSYTERSPSGRGLHILAIGTIPRSVKTAGFEMYSHGRAFTVTGNVFENRHAIEERPVELEAVFAVFAPAIPAPEPYEPSGQIGSRYGEKALFSAMRIVSMAADGSRNNTLFSEVASLVELVNAGALAREEVERAMTAAAITSGLTLEEASKTVASAFAKVTKARVIPPPRPRYVARMDAV